MAESVKDRVIAVLAAEAVLEPSQVALTASLDDLGIDSLGRIEAMYTIEEEFGITVPFDATAPGSGDFDISSVAAIIAAVETLIADQRR